ncbi:hypothetical protein [Moraxella ovis]|nr:hypothetical protein [Moraxella ovis]
MKKPPTDTPKLLAGLTPHECRALALCFKLMMNLYDHQYLGKATLLAVLS